MKLDDNSLTPLYQQVLEDIKAGIASGVYRPGNRIPSEPELSELYSVSRVTIRRAIEELVSFTDLCASMGMTAGARVLDRRIVPVRSEEQRFFGPACQQLVFVSRVRTADGIPIMEEDNYLPLEGFSFLLEAPLEDVSIFGVIRDRTGREIAHNSESTIEIALASAAMAKTLEISPGDPLFFEHVFFTDQNGLPTCVSSKYLVGSRYIFAF